MSHCNLGQLLKQFKLKKSRDFHCLKPGVKSDFLSRLYSTLEVESKRIKESLPSYGGVNLHFLVSRTSTGELKNLPTDVFLRKACFFANKTVITFPFTDIPYKKTERLKTSNIPKSFLFFGKYNIRKIGKEKEIVPICKNKLHYISVTELDSLLDLACTCKELLSSEVLTIIPSYAEVGSNSWRLLRKNYGLISANFKLDDLRQQFYENDLELKKSHILVSPRIYLPHFTNIPEKHVVSIREKEYELYEDFQYNLAELLYDLDSTQREREFLKNLNEIHNGVKKLNRKYEDMISCFRRKNIYALIGFTAFGLTVLLPAGIREQVQAMVGAITTMDWAKNKVDSLNLKSSLKQEECYLMWRICNMKA